MVSDEFAIANNFANIENMVINGHNISTKFKDHYQFISYSAFHASALTN